MTACNACLHFSECMERRGRCKEYKDLEEVRKDIAMLNQKARATKRTNADKTAQGERGAGDMPESFRGARKETARRDPEATEAGRGDKGIDAKENGGERGTEKESNRDV